jgi:hypothetical protein
MNKKLNAWNVVGSRQLKVGIRVPPIVTCLREDGSLYKELKEQEPQRRMLLLYWPILRC